MPADVKGQLEAYADKKKQHQSRRDGAAAYWVDSFRSLGVRDVVHVAASDGAGGAGSMREEIRFVDGKDGTPQRAAFDDNGDTSAAGETGKVDMEAIRARRVYVPVPYVRSRVMPPTLQDSSPTHIAVGKPSSSPDVAAPQETAPAHKEESPTSPGAVLHNDDGKIGDDIDDADFLADIDDDMIGNELSTLRAALGPEEEKVLFQQQTVPMGNADLEAMAEETTNLAYSEAESNNVSGTQTLQAQPDLDGGINKKKSGLLSLPKKATASLKQFISHHHHPSPPDETEIIEYVSNESSKKRQRRRISDKDMAPFDDEDAPAGYTEQDEVRDMASLSISEVIARESDLRGIMRPGNHNLLSALHESDVLKRLDDEMENLREADTAAYREALIRCPDQVSDERRMRFVYIAFGELPAGETSNLLHFLADPNRKCTTQSQRDQAARVERRIRKLMKECAEALARHWQLRYDFFGPDRCFLPMTLNGAMQDEVDNLVNRCIVQLLPVPDKSGRHIVYSDLTRRDFSKYSTKQECMAFFYFYEVIAEDLDSLRAGFISLHNSFGITKSSFNKSAREFAARSDDFSPLVCRALHVVNPSPIVHHLILPIVKNLFGKSLRLRVATHRGPPDKILRQLEHYRLPKECIPVELGGSLQLDMKEWVTKRMEVESERSRKLNASPDNLSEPMRTNLSPAIDAIRLNETSPMPEVESTTKRARIGNLND